MSNSGLSQNEISKLLEYDEKKVDEGYRKAMANPMLSQEDIEHLMNVYNDPGFNTNRYKIKNWIYWQWKYAKDNKGKILISFVLGFVLGGLLK